MASNAGKGDAQRPGTGYAEGFERIFGKPEEKLCNCKPGRCWVNDKPQLCKDWTKRAAKFEG